MRPALVIALAAVAISGCDTSSTPSRTAVQSGVAGTATFTSISSRILVPRCTSCHSEGDAQGGVSFSDYASTIASPGAVVPYQPHTSRLFLETYHGTMPEDGPPLSGDELEAIYTWIALGAPND